jgi:hypothetical protein
MATEALPRGRLDLGGHPAQAGSKRAPGDRRVRLARRRSSWPEGGTLSAFGGGGEDSARDFVWTFLWQEMAVIRQDDQTGPPAMLTPEIGSRELGGQMPYSPPLARLSGSIQAR